MRPPALIALLALVMAPAATAQSTSPEPVEMQPGEGRQITRAICSACHSIRLVVQQRLEPERWQRVIETMQRDHGMPPLPAASRDRILGYLATHYGPGREHRHNQRR